MRQNRFWYVREIPFPNIRNPQGTDFLKEKSSRNPAHWHFLSWLIYLMRRAKHTRKPIRRMNSNMITVDLKNKFKHDYNRSKKYIQTWLITMDLNSKLRHIVAKSEKCSTECISGPKNQHQNCGIYDTSKFATKQRKYLWNLFRAGEFIHSVYFSHLP